MADEENPPTEAAAGDAVGDASEQLTDFDQDPTGSCPTGDLNHDNSVSAIYDVPVHVSAVLGKATMPVNQLLKLSRGAVIELDRKVGEAIDILVNNRLVARGEVVIVEDRLGITMTEIVKSEQVE